MSQPTAPLPVFYDGDGRRQLLVSAVSWLALTVVGLLVAVLIVTALQPPQLRGISFGEAPRSLSANPVPSSVGANEPRILASRPRSASAWVAGRALRYGHVVTWDDKSFGSLRRNVQHLDVVIAEWLSVTDPSGHVVHADREHEANLRKWISQNAPATQIYAHVNNYHRDGQTWTGAAAAAMMSSAEARGRFVNEIEAYIVDVGLPGVVLDLEELPPAARSAYVLLAHELGKRLRPLGKRFIIQVPAGNAAYDYAGLAAAADGVIVMTYDEHVELGAPGPIAGQGWFEAQLRDIARLIPKSKLIVSVGSYGYDWSAYGKGREISVAEAWELLAETKSTLSFDQRSLNPSFSYRNDSTQAHHQVWFLDGVTSYNQVAAALALEPSGLALWRLGTEDSSVWPSLARGRMADQSALGDLRHIEASRDVVYKGEGEVLSVSGQPAPGQRALSFDRAQNLIVNQRITKLPSSTVVTRRGARNDKVVALTFDDGPDPVYTPQILNVLAEKDVKGTFFVVGNAAVLNSDLLQRIYREGHDIGNHTFTHINSAGASSEYLKFELNATQRLLEATIGVRTRLFRPPYATDIEPRTIEAAEALKTSTGLGYLTIGMRVDPKDWMRLLPRQIVESTLRSIRRGDGNVVLLHDAGGIRTATVQALPVIIDTLRSEGYRFVTVHELLGLQRADLMPEVDGTGSVVASLNFAGFSFFSSMNALAYVLFFLGIGLGALRLIWVSVFAVVQWRRDAKRVDLQWTPERFTVVIPAFNEIKVIEKSIESILASDCDNFQIIVVDDGSTDGTADFVEQRYLSNPRVKLLRKPNGGKWSALNAALRATDDDIVVTLDADTVFQPDALRRLVRHFHDQRIDAVAGHALIGNRINLLTRFQAIEYVTNQNLDRRALEVVNGITVVPGAIGAWRRSALLSIGGFASDTLAEDADATVRLHNAGWQVVCERHAVALTEAPETVQAFMRQRHRWMFGTLQVVYKNFAAIVRGPSRGMAWFGLPNIIVFQFGFTLAAPLIDLMMLWSLISGANQYVLTPSGGIPINLMTIGMYWLVFQVVEIAVGVLAIMLDGGGGGWRLLWVLPLQRFFYRQLLYVTACRVLFAALKGTLQGWGKLSRTGRVALES